MRNTRILRTAPPEIVFGLVEAGGETGGEPQHLLEAGESEAGAEAGLCDLTVDIAQHFTPLTEKYSGQRSGLEEM